MGSRYNFLDHKLHLASPVKHNISCNRRSSSSATTLPKTVSALHLKIVPVNSLRFSSGFFADTSLLKSRYAAMKIKGCRSYGGASSTTCAMSFSSETLRWMFAGSALLLMFLRNTAMNKSFLVPLLLLQAPQELVAWIRGDYGLWAAFLALVVRLFYYIPGELELPLVFVLLVITAPYQALDLRGSVAAMVTCAGVAAFLAYQHFSGAGGVKGSFKENTFLPSLAVVCLVAVPLAFVLGAV